MKRGMLQRSVSMLLALAMVLGNAPVNVWATETEETTAPACEHSYAVETVAEATCTEAGSVVYTCACGDTYTETVEATGHSYAAETIAEATCTEAGSVVYTCSCGDTYTETAEATGHSFGDWTVEAEATYETAGSKIRSCQCGEKETEVIPQLEKEAVSGESRKIYFLNTENWDEVYVRWFFAEEKYTDASFPGAEMEADKDLENVYVIEVPVEADEVTFSDGVEVTEELLAWEAEEGIEVIHFFEADLSETKDYYSAQEQTEAEGTEWLSYADLHEAWEEAKKAEEEAARKAAEAEQIAYVTGLIEALPTEITSDEQAAAVEATLTEIDAIVEADTFPADAYQALDWAKIMATYDALDAWDQIPVEENDPVVLANGTYNIVDNKLRVLNGIVSKDQLHTIAGDNWSTTYGYKIGDDSYNDVTWKNYSEVDLTDYHGQTITLAEKYNAGNWREPDYKYKNEKSYIIEVYYIITADVVNEVVPAGSGVKVTVDGTTTQLGDGQSMEVVRNSTVSVEAVPVNGYSIETHPAVVSPVVASQTVSVVYKADVNHSITVNAKNYEDGGTHDAPATVGDGESLTITVTPAVGNGYTYYIQNIETEGTVTYDGGVATITFESVTAPQTVDVIYGKHTIPQKEEYTKVAIDGTDKTSKVTGLKEKVLDAVLEGAYDPNEYEVQYERTIVEIGWLNWAWEMFLSVEGAAIDVRESLTSLGASETIINAAVGLLGTTYKISAEDLVGDISTSGTETFKIVRKTDPEVSLIVTVEISESRSRVEITVSNVTIENKSDPGAEYVQEQVLDAITIKVINPDGKETVITDKAQYVEPYSYTWPADGEENTTTTVIVKVEGDDLIGQTKTLTLTCDDTTIMYTVTFVDGQGNTLYSQKHAENTAMPAAPTATRQYYTFAGWNEEVAATVTGDVTYTAQWTINNDNNSNEIPDETETYTVIYTDGVEDEEIFADFVTENLTWEAATPSMDDPTREGWNFAGWDPAKAAKVTAPFEENSTTITYTAQWTQNFSVIFINDGEQYDTAEVEDGETVDAPTEPVCENYDFLGWYNGDKPYNFDEPVTGNLTLTAKWRADFNNNDIEDTTEAHYDIIYMDGEEELAKFEDVLIDLDVPTIENPTKPNFKFVGWAPELTEGDKVTKNVTYVAQWVNDSNNNGVDDAEETITIMVNKFHDNDAFIATGVQEMALSTADGAKSYIFDSTGDKKVTIVATPVKDGDNLVSYVKPIAEDGSYNNYVYTYSFTAENGAAIVVNFAEAKLTLNDPRTMDYHEFMTEVKNEDVFNAIVAGPEYTKETKIEYLARGAMSQTVQLSSLGLGDTIMGILERLNFTEFSFDMEPLWLDVNVETEGQVKDSVSLDQAVAEYVTVERITGLWDVFQNGGGLLGGGLDAVRDEIDKIYEMVYGAAMYYGAHNFGYNATGEETVTEDIKITYKSDAMSTVCETDVTLKDPRDTSVMVANDVTLIYKDYTDEELAAAVGAYVTDVNGNAIDNVEAICLDIIDPYTYEGKYASETAYELLFKFKGNADFKPSEKTVNVTINKAPVSLDLPNVNTTAGQGYNHSAEYTLGNKYGDSSEVEKSLIQFVVGLDAAELDVNQDGVKGLNGKIQLMLPADLQSMLDGLLGLTGGETSNGMEMSLGDLMKYLGSLSDDSLGALSDILNSINDIVETSNLTITIGGEYPTNTGAYLYGAVSTSTNYETCYDVAYILIAPKTIEHVLEWNDPSLTNALVTLPAFRNMDKGASVVGSEVKDMEVSYLILGINDETGDIYTTDVYGDINLNIWRNPEAINGNGGYVQMAYGIEWGNEFEYAKPIVRSFAIVPGLTEMEIVVDDQPVADLYKTVFDNAPVDVTVKGEIPEGSQVKLHYYGIEANTKTYDSDVAPTHTGAYAITATLVSKDAATGELTSVGLDVATVVIQPTESSVTMKELETVTYDGQNHKVSEVMGIAASSTVENLKPDTTVITASIATDGSFSENGWAAAQGAVNVDFPRWMDELIAKYAPSVKDGITLSDLEAKLLNKLPTITDKLEELGATNEMVNSTKNLLTNVSSLLEELPADAVLSFKDDYEVLAVGTYAVAAIVTDSDHVPAATAGVMVIVPSANQVYLDWEYHDENNIWSRDLLKTVSIGAIAYDDKEFTKINTEASNKITYQFIGLDQETGLKIYDNAADLPNGIYTQIAYIELEVDSQIVLSDIIVRTIVIVPNMPELQIVDGSGAAQDKFEFTFDNEPVELYVKQSGQTIGNQIRYIGLQTNGVEYDSTAAPVHAGAYAAITVLKTQENVGMDVALVTIAPAKANISVTGGTVAYDGMEHTATVKSESPDSTVTSPDYTLISGTVDISAGVQNVGLESLYGDVNIDLPKWLDDVLAETEFNRVDADVASVVKFISTYRNDLLKLIPDQMLESAGLSTETVEAIMQKLNGGIDELLKVLDKLPDNVHLTFESNKGYTELGSYFYYGIVTDSDHIPAADTGLLVIVPATITADDVEVTSQHVYNGKEQTVTVEIKVGDKILEAGRDYEVTGNTATNAGEYVMTVIGKGNYAGELSVEWSIEKAPVEVTLSDMTKTYGDGDPTLTYTVKGLTDGDSAANLNIAATREPGENVGTYVITATAENANYNITIINGTFTITKANAMVADAPAIKELTYTGEDQLLVDAGRSNDGKLMYSLDQNGEYTENIPTGKDANEYTVWYYVAGDANHEDSTKQSVKVIIKSKSITDVAVSLDGKPTFNGTAYVQNVIVKDGEYVLNLNDYEIIGNTATGAGKYTLSVKGKGNYAGEVKIEWSFGDGYPIYFQSGDANGMIHAGTTVFVDDVAYVLDENCVAWAADKNRELAIGYVYKNSGNHITDYAHSDTTKNMYIWDLQWNEETQSYKADRVEELDNLLNFAGSSIWLGSNGVNGIRTYYSTTAETKAVKGAFRNIGYEVVKHGVVVGWADKLGNDQPIPNANNSASGHPVGNGTFYDEIYPAADKYITPDLRARFFVELKNIQTSETKIIYSGSVERSIGYIAYQNIGKVSAQYQPYVKAILDKAAAAGFTYGNS